MKKRSGIRIAVISFTVVLAVILVAVASLLIYTNASASAKAAYTREQCIEAARQAVIERIGEPFAEARVRDIERDMRFEYGKLSSAMYVYEIELASGYMEYEVVVDAVTGKAVIVDIGD